jgi:hypothetical protein
MPLTKPALPSVSPGQPVTAQGWNGIVTAVGQLFDALATFGTEGLTVALFAGNTPVLDARVVAVPSAGEPVLAVPPFGDSTTFRLTSLTPGTWTVVAMAPGCAVASAPVTIPATAPLTVALTTTSVAMPNLFGMTVSDAIGALGLQSVAIDSIVDVFGGDVSKTAPAPERASSKVLIQYPPPGTLVVADSAAVRLVVAASPTTKDATTDAPKTKEASKELKDVGDDKRARDVVKTTPLDKAAEKLSDKSRLDKHDDKIDKVQVETGHGTLTDLRASVGLLPTALQDGASRRVFVPTGSRPAVGREVLAEPLEE